MRHDEKTTITIIPAPPRWELAILITPEDEPAYACYETIVAWDIKRTEGPYSPRANRPSGETFVWRYVNPITINTPNIEGMSNPWAIKQPDGKIVVADTETFDSEQKWIAYEDEQRKPEAR